MAAKNINLANLQPLPSGAATYTAEQINDRVSAEFDSRRFSSLRNRVAASALVRMLQNERLTMDDLHNIMGASEDGGRVIDVLKSSLLVPVRTFQPGSEFVSYGMRPAEIHKFMHPDWRTVQRANQRQIVSASQDKRGCAKGLEMHRKYGTLARMREIASGEVIPLSLGCSDFTSFAGMDAANSDMDAAND